MTNTTYEQFKRLFAACGNKENEVENGSYSIFNASNYNMFYAAFSHDAGNSANYLIEVNDDRKEVYIVRYSNSYTDIEIYRNDDTKKELDERLAHFLNSFEIRVMQSS